MSTISSVVFSNSQRNPTVTISGTGFGTAPATSATPAASGATGYNYGNSLFISDLSQDFSAGIFNAATNNSVGLINLSYGDTSISFQLGSAYASYLYNLKPNDSLGVGVNGTQYFATVNFVPSITTATLGIARFFDTATGTHFFTADPGEVQLVLNTRQDLIQEKGTFNAVDPTGAGTAAAPVYRFFDSIHGTHFFTSSATERSDVIAARPDLKDEGIGFYEHAAPQTGDVAVYRYFDTRFGTHFYTSDVAENGTILATRPDLKPEGISFYAPS